MNKYLRPINYLNKALHIANSHILHHAESTFAPNVCESLKHPPIFFLGAPRSGSTLAVQVITDALDVGYISNRHAQFFGAPGIAEKIFRPVRKRPGSNYCSNHGTTAGWHAPAECGEWWYRFFRRLPAYVQLDEVDEKKMYAFRRSVAALINAFDRPIIFKNLYASLRIQAIAHYLPESLFIVTNRNEVDNGHSLLEARLKTFGSYETWWSMEPPRVEQLKKLAPHEQVVEQIRHIHETIERDLELSKVQSSRRFDLSYEDFCESPKSEINKICDFLSLNDCKVAQRNEYPDSFKRRKIVRIDKKIYSAMLGYAKNF